MRATRQEKAHAWARYRRLMLWMALASIVAVVVALAWLSRSGPLPIHMMIATVAGVFFSVMLGTGLMGLVFLSAGAGIDDEAGTPHDDKEI